jgi:signal peptidase II
MKSIFKRSAVVFGAVVLFFVDRFIKYIFLAWPDYHLRLVGDWFSLGLAVNRGVAFGLPFLRWPLILLSATIIIALLVWTINVYLEKRYLIFTALIAIIVGAISNFIDRLKFGYVIDYFDLKYFSIFNLADILISLGVISLLILLYINSGKPHDGSGLSESDESCYN